jgi:hypothetical protein
MRELMYVAILCCSLFGTVPISQADLAVTDVQADTFVTSYETQKDDNFGGWSEFYVTALSNGVEHRGLLAFDTTDLVPVNASVDAIRLQIAYYRNIWVYTDPIVLDVYRIDPNDSWTELGVTWDNRPGLVGDPVGQVPLDASLSEGDLVAVDLSPSAWEAMDEFGLALLPNTDGDPDIDAQYSFFTRETDAANARLEVEFQTDTQPVPEPASSAFVFTGLLTLLLRFRRNGRPDRGGPVS